MIRKILPKFINNKLFGDRNLHGKKVIENDIDWINWQKFYKKFYFKTQKSGIGKSVNNLGYNIIKNLNFSNKTILEFGPGSLPHLEYWKTYPSKFIAVDTDLKFLEITKKKLGKICETKLIKRGEKLPIETGSIDIILTFYSLEHIFNLKYILNEFSRALNENGILVGAIPNEGGLAWGLGRYLTSRRFVKKKSDINYDKIICWEHPNFSDDILKELKNNNFIFIKNEMFPLRFIKSI
ncbi:class I SAM-dependent methyltransferase, partial [Candidatus Pelagibacter sp.]|nr:class I SAM-dependent methyltransferase [Candidatus Pelagibacter sp.]